MFLAEPDIADRIADEAQEFLTGFRSEAEPDRVLATVMFTDIVDFDQARRRARRPRLGRTTWSPQ